MCDHNCSVKKAIPTPVAKDMDDVDDIPGVVSISDSSSVDFSLLSCASESEGGIYNNKK
jgi:hypothetical protein